MPSDLGSSGVHCWVAAGDIDIRRQSFTPRRATPPYFHLPKKAPADTTADLLADIREGLEEVFDRPDCRAPFIPGYKNKDDAIKRVKLLRGLGREVSEIILIRMTFPQPNNDMNIPYRLLEGYAGDVSYQGVGLNLSTDQTYIICAPLTKAHLVERLEVLG